MFKNYKRMYIEERGERAACELEIDFLKSRLKTREAQLIAAKKQIEYYETTCKKAKRLSNIGFWCGVASLVFVTGSMILKAVL